MKTQTKFIALLLILISLTGCTDHDDDWRPLVASLWYMQFSNACESLEFPAQGAAVCLRAGRNTGKNLIGEIDSWRTTTQNTRNYRPLYVVNTLNSQPVVRFDGGVDSNDHMISDDPLLLTADLSIFAVVKTNNTAYSGTLFAHSGEAGDTAESKNTIYGLGIDGTGPNWVLHGENGVGVDVGSTVTGTATTAPTTAYSVVSVMRDSTLKTVSFGNNGAFETITYATNPTGGQDATTRFYVGSLFQTTQVWDGDIAEIIVYPRLLSTAEHKQMECYLGLYYAITVTGC